MASAQIAVRLTPRAHREEIVGLREGVLLVRVTAPPVDGRANRALCRLVARRLAVAPSRVTVARGESAREKLLSVQDMDARSLRHALQDSG
jgi:uncharacterized protein